MRVRTEAEMGVTWRWISALTLALCVVVGCVQLKQEADVYPDGSGRIRVRLTMPDDGAFSATNMTVQTVYEDAAANCAGFVAVTDATLERRGDRRRTEFVGWFEDANDVRVQGNGLAGLELSWEQDGDAYVLGARPGFVRRAAQEAVEFWEQIQKLKREAGRIPPEAKAQLDDMVERRWGQFTEGFEVETVITLPGKIESVEGFEQVDERTVRIHVEAVDMTDLPAMRRVLAQEYRARCDGSLVSDEDAKAFTAELDAAREAWAQNPAGKSIPMLEVARVKPEPGESRVAVLAEGSALLFVNTGTIVPEGRLLDRSGKELARLPLEGLAEGEFHLSPDGKRLHVVDAPNSRIVTLAVASGERLWEIKEPRQGYEAHWQLDVAADGELLVYTNDRGIDLYDGETGVKLRSILPDPYMVLLGTTQDPAHVLVSHDGAFRVLDTGKEEQLWLTPATIGGADAVGDRPVHAWDAQPIFGNRMLLVSAFEVGTEVSAHDSATGELRWRMRCPSPNVHTHPQARHAVVVAGQGVGILVDLDTGEFIGRLAGLPADGTVLSMETTGSVWVQVGEPTAPELRRYLLTP